MPLGYRALGFLLASPQRRVSAPGGVHVLSRRVAGPLHPSLQAWMFWADPVEPGTPLHKPEVRAEPETAVGALGVN